MSEINNGTTPAPAATLPNVVPVVTTPPVTTPPQGEGKGSDGKVTIDLKEYRDLQRAKARTLSFDKRVALKGNSQPTNNPDGSAGDPEIVERLNQESTARLAAERRSLQLEVKGRVRDLLDTDEFKPLPKSTRELILKNPALLSEADNLDEAMIDIEEFVRDQVLSMDKVPVNGGGQQVKNDVPPVVNGGNPAPVVAVGLEDVSKLSGPARSQATIRNKMREAKGIK